MVADIGRLFRHLFSARWRVRRAFPARAMRAIEAEIRQCEAMHEGELRFAVEGELDFLTLLRNQSARERAIEVFSQLRVWDTGHNNGVLIYLLLADHDVEIIADRGIHAHVGDQGWEAICRDMERAFRQGRFEEGVIAGIRAVGAHLARHYPRRGEKANELPNAPVIL
ncbi:MAG: TPM domain-containing protein [Pseudomonadota bacterium]|jgi:hypothetical protein